MLKILWRNLFKSNIKPLEPPVVGFYHNILSIYLFSHSARKFKLSTKGYHRKYRWVTEKKPLFVKKNYYSLAMGSIPSVPRHGIKPAKKRFFFKLAKGGHT